MNLQTVKPEQKQPPSKEPIRILTIYDSLGRQSFNNQNYSWSIDSVFVKVIRDDQKFKLYIPMHNILKIEIEEVKT